MIKSWHCRCLAAVEMARSLFDRSSRVRPWLCLYGLIAGTVLMIMAASGQAVPAGNEAPQTAAKVVRPTKAEEHGATIDIADMHVPELVNQRGIEVFTTSPEVKGEGDVPATFGRIVIRNCEIGNLKRDEVGALSGVQVEGIRITGAGDQQAGSTDVVIEDVYLHDVQGSSGPSRFGACGSSRRWCRRFTSCSSIRGRWSGSRLRIRPDWCCG